MTIDILKRQVKTIISRYPDREQRARRIFIEERPASFNSDREREFIIKSNVSDFFRIPYSSVSFCGSAQLGFSVHKNRVFQKSVSDLDIACISVDLFQIAWRDIVSSTRAFKALTKFGRRPEKTIDLFKLQILNRGMINVSNMPISGMSREWIGYQDHISRQHSDMFKSISFAIYMNEYAFCWKQDSALSGLGV